MSQTALRVEHLSKRYQIGRAQSRPDTLRDAIISAFRRPGARAADGQDTIWALKDASFEVRYGEVVGVIGRNGAGKSTLLKILSRITEPTEGRVEVYGRVGSLLEVGTGFHPELTGRENVYLNGAILGMRRAEIERHFEEIVAFAEVEKFIDTPVKRYSSGMYLRLAFAVAAHLNPEILIVDEVLAVGDAAFQKKCLGKMGEVARQGRTVLFVSHNMHAVASLCEKAIWLDAGVIRSTGPAPEQVAKYTSALLSAPAGNLVAQDGAGAPASVREIRLLNAAGEERDAFDLFEPFTVELSVVQRRLPKPIRLIVRLRTAADGAVVLATTDWDAGRPLHLLEACAYTARCLVPGNLLNSGSYLVSVAIDEPMGPVHFRLEDVKRFTIVNASPLGDGVYGERDGVLSPYRQWELVSSEPLEAGRAHEDVGALL